MPDGGGGKENLCSVSSPSDAYGATSPWRGRIARKGRTRTVRPPSPFALSEVEGPAPNAGASTINTTAKFPIAPHPEPPMLTPPRGSAVTALERKAGAFDPLNLIRLIPAEGGSGRHRTASLAPRP